MTTSDFALAWTERRIDPPKGSEPQASRSVQSQRRFLDYSIDGDPFYRRHREDLISVLGWFAPQQDELAAQRLIGAEPPDLDGRTAIAVCPEDGDLMCGALTARIIEECGEVQWTDLAYSWYDAASQTWTHDPFHLAHGPELRFDAEQYKAAIRHRSVPERDPRPPS